MSEQRPGARLRRVLIVAAVVAVVAAVPVVASASHVSWLSAGRTYGIATVPERPVGMVLGAKASDGGPSAFLAARLDLAAQLYAGGKVQALLVSGDGRPPANNEPQVMKDYLVARGVPADKIVEDAAGFDTYDSCLRARDVFGVTAMTVVTQDYHLGRALGICREIGIDAVGVGDGSMLERYPYNWAKGVGREALANLKMEWDLRTRRAPQQDPFDAALLDAAGG